MMMPTEPIFVSLPKTDQYSERAGLVIGFRGHSDVRVLHWGVKRRDGWEALTHWFRLGTGWQTYLAEDTYNFRLDQNSLKRLFDESHASNLVPGTNAALEALLSKTLTDARFVEMQRDFNANRLSVAPRLRI